MMPLPSDDDGYKYTWRQKSSTLISNLKVSSLTPSKPSQGSHGIDDRHE